jgi:hypothetical protein
MEWEVEKEEKIEILNSWIEATSEEIEFVKALCEIIEKSSSKQEFIRMAEKKLQEYQNPWLQKELNAILNLAIS